MATCLTLTDLNDWPEHKPLLKKAIQQATESLDIMINSPMFLEYAQEPIANFSKFESFLTNVYGYCTTEAFQIQKPLLDINIIPMYGNAIPKSNYDKVAVGGTWDHLHAGHKILLTMTAFISRHEVVCGVTDYDEMAIQKKKFNQCMQPLEQRIRNVEHFLKKVKNGVVYRVSPIKDAYGPTKTDPHIQALVGSYETQAGCEAVNIMRNAEALPSLNIFLIHPLVLDHQSMKLSSSKIREYLEKKEMSVFLHDFLH